MEHLVRALDPFLGRAGGMGWDGMGLGIRMGLGIGRDVGVVQSALVSLCLGFWVKKGCVCNSHNLICCNLEPGSCNLDYRF